MRLDIGIRTFPVTPDLAHAPDHPVVDADEPGLRDIVWGTYKKRNLGN